MSPIDSRDCNIETVIGPDRKLSELGSLKRISVVAPRESS